jgi:hypothetical protein
VFVNVCVHMGCVHYPCGFVCLGMHVETHTIQQTTQALHMST